MHLTNARWRALEAAHNDRLISTHDGNADSLARMCTGVHPTAFAWARIEALITTQDPAPKASGQPPRQRHWTLTERGRAMYDAAAEDTAAESSSGRAEGAPA